MQTLEYEEREIAQPDVDAAKLVQEQDVQLDVNNKTYLIKGMPKDRRICIEDSEMRYRRKSRSVRVNGPKCHVLQKLASLY